MQIAVIGAGSWGTALALVAARAGNDVRLWAHDPQVAALLRNERQNSIYLPGVMLPEKIEPTGDLARVLEGVEIVLTVVPSHVCREVYGQMLPRLTQQMILVSATKGIEIATQMRIEEVVRDVIGRQFEPRYVALSGPSFAHEVGKDEPCAVVAAARYEEWAKEVQAALSSRRFRIYTNTDVVGVEVSGAVKNVMAIATGAVNGLGFGYNSAAALVTRGLAEMTRLAAGLGGRLETMAGLAGVGDLMLTCLGSLSRNRHVGYELGRGRRLQEIIGEMREVAEGVKTAKATHELAGRVGVEMPITTGVYRMLYEDKSPRELAAELMERPLKGEGISG
ncbi:MAG TPA: NAD(P)H-dependent glycerol-3-phosphate dehydrogenase [Blastocatellia bacterium]|nr:NAD(P)H-dependent glycerol-3-phosphate dehydrogenase [Blastocatellia bacterium]